MQAELLPALSTDAMSAISKMTENLADFNSTFSTNTSDLRDTLTAVKESTQGQAEILGAIEKLKIQKIASANVEVYDKLKGCTNEIGLIADCLKSSSQYLQQVRELSNKLDESERRTRLIEEMANYFMKERTNLDAIGGVISKTMGSADDSLQEAARDLKESIKTQYEELSKHLIKEREEFEKVADEQQSALGKRMAELTTLTNEIKNLTSVKTSMDNLVKSTDAQNKKIDKLTESISQMAAIKSGVSTTPIGFRMPKWIKVAGLVIAGIFAISSLMTIVAIIVWFVI